MLVIIQLLMAYRCHQCRSLQGRFLPYIANFAYPPQEPCQRAFLSMQGLCRHPFCMPEAPECTKHAGTHLATVPGVPCVPCAPLSHCARCAMCARVGVCARGSARVRHRQGACQRAPYARCMPAQGLQGEARCMPARVLHVCGGWGGSPRLAR